MTREQKKKEAKLNCELLTKSWTYNRMTEEEKNAFYKITEWIINCGVLEPMRTSQQINALFSAIYTSFLEGIGYTGANWRD